MAKFTITVTATLNGKSCKNPQIEFIQGEGYIYPCEIKDGVITIEILPGAPANACIEGYIKCDDTCLNCPPQYFKKCLCNDVTVLTVCQRCVDGFIVEICTPEQLAQGMICTPDGCVCPPDKPVKDPNTGQCVQCITGTVLDCKVCLGGVWVYIDCPPNSVCKGDRCECAPGYVLDPHTGECVPPPQCSDDEDCGICETCVNGVCVPVVCPPNHRCIDGICVYWPCTSVTCNNGADCGEDCGCLNGECVPCHLLNCKLDASCQSALGCRCNALDLCEPVPDCGQYCDGETPCLDTNCTCYNNRCVDCSRFPCPEDCATHYNCGCNAEGDCDGGKACTDTLTLKKEEVCSNDGCQLVADYTTENKCMCDPIEFRISNTRDCTGEVAGTVLVLKTEIFKNNLPYKDYLSIVGMGDDELVSGTITTHIDFFTKNSNGLWIPETVTNAPVANVSIVDNKIDLINITPVNLGFLAPNSVITANRKVVITLRATGVEIPNNDCKKYNSAVIATYEIDLTASTIYCPVINSFKTIKSTFLKDTVSTRRPLFVWSKSTTGTFANTKFVTNGVYTNSGWFRKEYGNHLIAGKWQDKINNPKRGVENEYNELWNNYNYKVKVDCGCKSNDATLQKVVFCCPKEFDYTITDCGRTITIPPFDTCSVNKHLGGLFSDPYTIPIESQTFYWLVINNNTEKVLVPTGGNIVSSSFTYTHTEPITSIRFEQRYQGTPLVPVACPVEYTEDPDLPDFTVTSDCGTIVVTKNSGSPAITAVTSNTSGVTFTPSAGNTVWTSTSQPLAVSSSHVVKATFSGTCVVSKTVNIVCDTIIEAVPTSIRANGECPNGTNPNIKVTAIEGFSSAVKFSKDGITYVDPDPLVAPETRPSKTFTNFGAGVYVFYAKETINGVEVIATTDVEIVGMLQPTAIFDPSATCGNTGSMFKIQGGAPSSTWIITGPQYPGPTGLQIALDSNGSSSTPVGFMYPGTYTAQILTDPSNSTCIPQNISATLTTGGGTVSPTIAFQSSSVCQGQPVGFAIRSGQGLIFNLLTANGVIKDQNGIVVTSLVSIENGFNGTFTPSTTGASTITISSIANNSGGCFILSSQSPYSLTVSPGPIIVSSGAICTPNAVNQYDAYVVTSGTVSGVLVSGSGATESFPGSNYWLIRNVTHTPFVDTEIDFIVLGGSCSAQGKITLPICNDESVCPPQPQSVTIDADVPSCGEVTKRISFISSSLGYLGSPTNAEYQWISVVFGTEFVLETGTIVNPNNLYIDLPTSFQGYNVFLRVTLNQACVYDSNMVYMLANQLPNPTISGQTVGVTTTGSYQYSVTPTINGTYVWTLTNTAGTNPVGSTTSNIVTISNFLNGFNTLAVTITDANGCIASSSIIVNVALNCPQTVLIQSVVEGGGDPSCKNLKGIVSNLGATTIASYEWMISNAVIQSGVGSSITDFDTSVIAAGTANNVTLRVIFANGCDITSDIYSYTKCSCMCFSNNCISVNNYRIGVHTVGEFQAGTEFDWGVYFFGKRSTNHIVKLDGVTIFATGFLTASETLCTFTNPCDGGTQYLGDDPATTNLALTGASGAAWSHDGDTSPNTYVDGGCLALTNDGVVIPNTALWGTGVNSITLPTAGLVTVEVINGVCDSALSASNRNEFYLECV